MTTRSRDLELTTPSIEREDRVLIVRVCDPSYNYMTTRMHKDLDILTATVDDDATVGAVILTGVVPNR